MFSWSPPSPDKTYTKSAIVDLLHISESTLDRMIADGEFPVGLKPTPQTGPIWTGADLAAWFHLAPKMKRKSDAGEDGGKK